MSFAGALSIIDNIAHALRQSNGTEQVIEQGTNATIDLESDYSKVPTPSIMSVKLHQKNPCLHSGVGRSGHCCSVALTLQISASLFLTLQFVV